MEMNNIMELVPLPVLEQTQEEEDNVPFQTSDHFLQFLKKKNISLSHLKDIVDHLKELRRESTEGRTRLEELEGRLGILMELHLRDSTRYEEMSSSKSDEGLKLLNAKKKREALVKSFIELKGNYEEMIAKQHSEHILEGQVRFQQRSSRAATEKEADTQTKRLQDKIQEIDDQIASLDQELTRKNQSILDLEQKLEQVQKSVNELKPVLPPSTQQDFDQNFRLQLLPD